MKKENLNVYVSICAAVLLAAALFYLNSNHSHTKKAPIAAISSISDVSGNESATESLTESVPTAAERTDVLSKTESMEEMAQSAESNQDIITAGDINPADDEDTPAQRATRLLHEEIEHADKSYISKHTFVTITSHTYEGMNYYLTHIIIDSPTQIKAGMSYDDYGGTREKPSDASKRQHWVVGINGSNFSYSTGGCDTSMADVIIKNGQVMPDSQTVANGFEICLTSDGEIFSPIEGWTADDLIRQGITDTFTCGDTLLIEEGFKVYEEIQSHQVRYPRTAIGMVKPGEYYFLTTLQDHKSGGGTYTEVRDALANVGCRYAKCMDGGGSSALVFQNEVINRPADGTERPVADFLYIVDAETLEDDQMFALP